MALVSTFSFPASCFLWLRAKVLTVPTQTQLPKPRLRLEAASQLCGTALTQGSRRSPRMCSLWLMLVTSTHFCPCPAAPASPATLLGLREPAQRQFLPRLQVYGCERQGTPGLGVPQFLRGVCCLQWPLRSLQPTPDLSHLPRPRLSLWARPCPGTVRLVVVRWQKRRRGLSSNKVFTLLSSFGECLAEEIWSFKKPESCAVKKVRPFSMYFSAFTDTWAVHVLFSMKA